MRKLALPLAMLAGLVPALAGATPQPRLDGVRGTVWVTDRLLNRVGAFDAATGLNEANIPVGVNPIGIVAPKHTGKVYVSNENSNTVSVVSKESLSVVATIGAGSRPHHMIASKGGDRVYVAEFGQNTVAVIDTAIDAVVNRCVAGPSAARTHAPWITSDGILYATNSVDNTIAAMDADSCTPLWTLQIGNNPSEVLVTRNGATAYVSVRNENKVKVVDTALRTIVGEVVVGTMPDTLQLTDNERTLIVTLRGTPAQATYVDTETLAAQQVTVGGTGTIAGHHWLSNNSRYTYVAVEGPGSVAVLDNHSREVAATFLWPGTRPHGVYFDKQDLTE
jgi:YVTN family beta-propeller protein